MSPVPSQVLVSAQVAQAQKTTSSAVKFTALPFHRIPVIGIVFLILLIVVVVGIFVYVLFKLFRPRKASKDDSLLPKFILADEALAAIAAKTLSVTDQQQVIVYKIGANGVKKGIRIIFPSSVSPFLPPVSLHIHLISCISKVNSAEPGTSDSRMIEAGSIYVYGTSVSAQEDHPYSINTNSSSYASSTRIEELKCSAPHSTTPTNNSISQNAADLKVNQKLFPVQGPLRSMDTSHTRPSVAPPNVNGQLPALEPTPSSIANACSQQPTQSSVVASASPHPERVKATLDVKIMNKNPKLFPVQGPIKPLDVRSTNVQLPANASTATTIVHNDHPFPKRSDRFNASTSRTRDSKSKTPGPRTISIRNIPYIKSASPTRQLPDMEFYENKYQYSNSPAPRDADGVLSIISPGNRPMYPASRSGFGSRTLQDSNAKISPSGRRRLSRDLSRSLNGYDSKVNNATVRTIQPPTKGKENASPNLSSRH